MLTCNFFKLITKFYSPRELYEIMSHVKQSIKYFLKVAILSGNWAF